MQTHESPASNWFLIGLCAGYGVLLSIIVVRAVWDEETTRKFVYVLCGMLFVVVVIQQVWFLRKPALQREALRLNAATATLARSVWLEWALTLPQMLLTTIVPVLLSPKWHSEMVFLATIIGAGIAFIVAGWNQRVAKAHLAKHSESV